MVWPGSDPDKHRHVTANYPHHHPELVDDFPGIVLILLRLAYKARLLCDGTVARVMIAVGLVTVGAVMFLSCFITQWFLVDFLIAITSLYIEASVLATSALLIMAGVGTVLLWLCMPAIRPYSPSTGVVDPERITAEEVGDTSPID